MPELAAGLLGLSAAILFVAALWHVYWAIGGRIGITHAIPQRNGKPTMAPTAAITLAVAALIAAVAAVYAAVAFDVVPGVTSSPWAALLLGVFGLVFLARAVGDFNLVGFFKRPARSGFAFADSRYFSPLCVFLGLSGLSATVPAIRNMIG